MRLNVQRMLYSPERSSLAGTAPTGSVLHQIIFPAGMHSGQRHTLYGVKDENGSSMGRGYKSIDKLSAFFIKAYPQLLLCCFTAFGSVYVHAQPSVTPPPPPAQSAQVIKADKASAKT